MPESSVKITVGVELDKSELEKQIKDFQEELKQYKLQMGIDVVPSDSSNASPEESDLSQGGSPAQPPAAQIDFDELSDIVSNGVDSIKSMIEPLTGQITDLIDFIRQVVSGIREDLQPLNDLAETQKQSGSELTKVTQEAITDIKNEIVDAVKDGVKEISDSTTSTIKEAAGQISGDIREQLEKILSNQGASPEGDRQDKPPLPQGKDGKTEIIELPPPPSDKDGGNSGQPPFNLEELINAIKDLFSDIKDATQSVKDAAGDVSGSISSIISTVEDALNPLKALTSSAKEILQELTDIAKSSLSDLKDLLVQTLSDALEAVSGDIKSLLDQYLKEILDQIKAGLMDLLQSMFGKKSGDKGDNSDIEVVDAEIVVETDDISKLLQDIISILESQKQNALPSADTSNIRGAISSAVSSTNSLLDSLYQLISDRLSEIAGRLLPSILKELQFDFLKSLVGGAVEDLGATLIKQFSTGSANVLQQLVTGKLFESSDPAADATLAFGDGFDAGDPTNTGKIIQKLDILLAAIAAEQQKTPGSQFKEVTDSVNDSIGDGGVDMNAEVVDDELPSNIQGLINSVDRNSKYVKEVNDRLSGLIQTLKQIGEGRSEKQQDVQGGDIIDVEFRDVTSDILSGVDLDLSKLLPAGKNDDGGGESDRSDEILQDILRANQDLVIINREGIQERRTNIDQISGRSELDDIKRGGREIDGRGRPRIANAQLESILSKTTNILREIPGNLQELANGLLKGAEIAGVNTDGIVNILDIIGGLGNLVDIIYKVNPDLASALTALASAIGQDAVDILINAVNVATEKLPELAKNFDSVEIEDKTIDLAQQGLDKVLPNSGINVKELVDSVSGQVDSLSQKGKDSVDLAKGKIQEVGGKVGDRFPITRQVFDNLTASADKLTVQINKLSEILTQYLGQSRTSEAASDLGQVVKDQINNIITPDELQRAAPTPRLNPNQSQSILNPSLTQLDLDQFLPPELHYGDNIKQPDSMTGQVFPSIQLPGLQDVLPDFNQSTKPTTDKGQRESIVVSMFNFIKNNLPQVVAGLLLAKLAATLTAKIAAISTGGKVKPDFTGVQSLLTKGIAVAGSAVIAKIVLPKIAEFFRQDKKADSSTETTDRKTDKDSVIITPPPQERLALPPVPESPVLPIPGQLLLSAGKDTSNIFPPSLTDGGRLPEIPNDLLREAQSGGDSVEQIGQDFLNILQNKLPQIIAGLLLAKLVTAIGGRLAGARPDNGKGAITGGVQSLLTKGLLAAGGVAIAKLAAPKLGQVFSGSTTSSVPNMPAPQEVDEMLRKPVAPDVGAKGSDLPKVIAILVAGYLAKDLISSFTSGLSSGQERQRSLIEKGLGFALKGITSGVGKQKDLLGKEGSGLKSMLARNLGAVLPGKDQNKGLLGGLGAILLGKLPSVLSSVLIGLLIAKLTPLIMSAVKPVNLSETNDAVNILGNPKDKTPSPSETVDIERLQSVFNSVFDDVVRSSGIDPEKVDKNNLRPNLKVDEENRLKGASSYRGSNNQILLSQKVAQGLTSPEIPREVFVELVHEIRHAMQAGFGTNLKGRAEQISSGKLQVGKGVDLPLLDTSNLIDPDKIPQVKAQVDASTKAVDNALPNQKGLVEALELDAEVFAQNFADLIYGIEPDDFNFDDLFRINEELANTLGQGLEGIKDAIEKQSSTGETAVDLVQAQKERVVQSSSEKTSKPVKEQTNQAQPTPLTTSQEEPSPQDKSAIATNNSQEKPKGKLSLNTILTAIQSQIQDLISVAKAIAQDLTASLEKEIKVDGEDLIPDTLLRGAPPSADGAKDEKDQRLFGEKVGDFIGDGIDRIVDRVVDKAQKAGMSDDDIQEMANQAGAYTFSMLSSFAPGGAVGLLVAPIAASLSSLGIPIAAAVNQLAPLAQMLVDTMQTLTPIQTRFTTIGGGEQEGQDMFNFAADTAKSLNVPMLSAIEGYSRLAAASQGTRLEGKDTEELFLGITKAIAALGLSAQDSSLIFLAFQQILSKGVVTAEELRGQISERLPGALQIFADALGLTLPELSKALENGELNLTKLAKLGPAFQKEFAAGAEKSSRSFIGALNKIENSILQLKISFVEQFGGIVGGIANVIAGALGLIGKFIDSAILKSGLLFNAILGIQAYALAGTFAIFSKLAISQNLIGAISGAYARLFPILLPFFFGTFVELISSAFGSAFKVEIESAVTLITGFFSNVIGRVIQQVIDLSRDPRDALEGLVNIIRNIALTLFDIADASKYVRDKMSENFGFIGKAIEGVLFKGKELNKVINRNTVNKLADNAIARVFAPGQPATITTPEQPQQGGFDLKKIAQTGFEFFGLYIILIQTLQLVKIIGEQFGISGKSIGTFFKALLGAGGKLVTFGKGLFSVGVSLSTFKGLLNVVTAGLMGSSLVLGVLVTLFALIVAKSDVVNSFLSETSNSIKELQKLNTSIDNVTGKKVELTVETTYTEKGGRETPFQDKGLRLSFWRDKNRDQLTTDDITRAAQRLIDDKAYRRNLPLIPGTPTRPNDDPTNTGNIKGLQTVLTSQVTREVSLNNAQQVIDLRQELIKEKKRVEDELIIELGLNTRNLDQEINKLRGEIDDLKTFALDSVTANLSIKDGGENIERIKQDRERQLRAQIAELEKQREINQGALIIEGTSVNIETDSLEKELEAINKQLSEIDTTQTTPILVTPSIETSNPLLDQTRRDTEIAAGDNNFTELAKRRDEIVNELAIIRQVSGLTKEEIQSQLAELQRQRDELASQSVRGGGDRNAKTGGFSQEINTIDRQIEVLVKFEGQKEIDDTRKELDRINRDLNAFNLFAENPAVFNNAFLQDDSLIKQIAVDQVGLFPSVNDQDINTQRLLDNNAVTEIPLIREDIALKQSKNARAIADLNNAIEKLDVSAPNAEESLTNLRNQIELLQKRNKSLTSLDLLLSTTESYARLGMGKAALDAQSLADSLQSLAQELASARIQTTQSAGFIAKPSLQGMVELEQEILMQFGQQNTALRQARSERENIESTPELSITEKDLGRFGYLSEQARNSLRELNREISRTRETYVSLRDALDERMDDGILSTVSFDEWNKATQEIEAMRSQLEELIKQRDAILQDAAKLAPPIQVDPNAREQRIQQVDAQIADIEGRLADLNTQYQAIQGTKLEISGATAIASQLDSAIRDLRLQDTKFLGFLPNLVYGGRLRNLEETRKQLDTSLPTVNTFVGKQTQLDSVSLQGLLGGLQSGDLSTTQKTLEQFDIQGNRVFFNGQELEGTPEEVRAFIDAINDASKALKGIQELANSPFKGGRTEKALQTNLGLEGGDETRNRLLGEYRDTATRLFMSGALKENQFQYLLAPGRNLAEVEKALGDIANQGGQTNFGAIMQTLAEQGVPEEERRQVIQDLTKIQDLVEDLKGTDPARSLLPSFGKLGEVEYNETIARIDEIDRLAFEAFNKLSLAGFTGDLKQFEKDLIGLNPELLGNLNQLREIQDRLDVIGKERLKVQDELARNDLTIEERNALEKQSATLDEEYRTGYRRKKEVGVDLAAGFQQAQSANTEIESLIKNLQESDIEEGLKRDTVARLQEARDNYLNPILEFFGQVEELVALSADESMALAFKNISRSLKNLQDSSARIQDETNKILAASSLKFREISTNLETTPLTQLGVSGAGTNQDATIFDAQLELNTALTDERSRKQVRDIAFQEFTRSQEEFQKAREAAAGSPVVQQEELAPKREELTQITEQYTEAEQAYAQALTASSQARIALLEAETNAVVRRTQLSNLLEQAVLKEKRLRGEINDETFDTESATQEFENISVELAAAETLFKAITADVEKGLVPSVVEANRRLEELNRQIAELKNQQLDSQLELENAIRARANQLIENQINLTSKYLDLAIAGYERLNGITANTTKQLDGLSSLGQAIQSVFTSTSQRAQTSLGQQSNLLGQILQGREVLKSEDATPEERKKAQERDGDLRKLAQMQGVNISPNSSEAQVLAKQAEIEAKLAQAKIEALKKEQAIANALLKIEIERNRIAAEQAVKEAEINKLKQQQAVYQAQGNLQKAAIEAARTGDQTGYIMAQLDLQIAQSQLATATEGIDIAKQNVLIQEAIADLQLEQASIDSANAKDNLVGELASNQNLDLGKILGNINSLLNFTPSDRTSRDVFTPYLPKPKQDTFIPEITVSLDEFNGDVNAWMNANIEANRERREQMQQQNPEASAIQESAWDVFGRPQQTNISYGSGNLLGSLEDQFAALSDQTLGSRWGKLLAPTKEQIMTFTAEAMIQQGIDKGMIAPNFDPKAMGLDPITLLPLLPEILADVPSPTTEDMQQGAATFEEVAASSLETTNKTLDGIYGVVDEIPHTFIKATEQLGQMLINDQFKPIVVFDKDSQFGFAELEGLLQEAGLITPAENTPTPSGFSGAKAIPFGQNSFTEVPYSPDTTFNTFSNTLIPERFASNIVPNYLNQPYSVDSSATSLARQDLTSMLPAPIQSTEPVSTTGDHGSTKPQDTEFVKHISPTVRAAKIVTPTIKTPIGAPPQNPFKPTIKTDAPLIPEPSVNLKNVVNPNIQVPRQEKTPFYFYRDIASEMSPHVDYTVPPGVQALGQQHNYRPESTVQNISVNITNQIDANTQKDFFSKMARVQQEAIISAINNA